MNTYRCPCSKSREQGFQLSKTPGAQAVLARKHLTESIEYEQFGCRQCCFCLRLSGCPVSGIVPEALFTPEWSIIFNELLPTAMAVPECTLILSDCAAGSRVCLQFGVRRSDCCFQARSCLEYKRCIRSAVVEAIFGLERCGSRRDQLREERAYLPRCFCRRSALPLGSAFPCRAEAAVDIKDPCTISRDSRMPAQANDHELASYRHFGADSAQLT